MTVSISQNRNARKWSKRELIARVLWAVAIPFFRYSPRLLWGWRRSLLRAFGATVGKHVHIHPSARIFIPWNLCIEDYSSIGFDALLYNLGPMKIGHSVTVSQRAHLCGGSHDYDSPAMDLIKASITIEDDAWVCADAFVAPGVTIGRGAVVGARAVVTKEVAPYTIVAGNPAKFIKQRTIQQ